MKNPIALILVLFFSSLAWANGQFCLTDFNDPFAPNAAMTAGKYKGMCIETSKKRAVKILKNDESILEVANFYHNNRWWTAKIPKNSIQDTIFQITLFETSIPFIVAAHTQIRMKFDPERPVVLVPQNLVDQLAGVKNVTLTDAVYSVEFIAPAGVSYSIFKGQFNHLGIVGRFLSMEARSKEQIKPRSSELLKQIPLNLTREEMNKVLENAMIQSEAMGIQEQYNTLSKNCTTELFTVLDKSINYNRGVRPFKVKIFNMLDPIEKPSLKALEEREIIDLSRSLRTYNEEVKLGPGSCQRLF